MSEAGKARGSAPPVIPDKLYFRIGEVSRLLAVEPHTLRFWESEFPQLRVNKGGTGQRLYRRKDVETAIEIRHLLYEQGYTIPGARQWLQNRSRTREKPAELPFPGSPAPAPATQARVSAPLAGLHRLRSDLRELSAQLARSVPAASSHRARRVTPDAVAQGRRGLHLATRGPHLATRTPRELPSSQGLFGPEDK